MSKSGHEQPLSGRRVSPALAARTSTKDVGNRVKAAIVLSTGDRDDLKKAKISLAQDVLKISLRTLDRLLQGKRPPKEGELEKISRALAVPEWWLRHGFDGQEPPPEMQLLTNTVELVLEEVRGIRAALDLPQDRGEGSAVR